MCKINTFITLCLMVVQCLPVIAQQLPNNGFETWVNCYPWSSKNNTNGPFEGTNQQGTTPQQWCISNVFVGTGFADKMGNKTLGQKVAGYNGSTAAAELMDVAVTSLVKQHIPAYMALGTTWSTSKGTGSNKAGGSFGGLDFNYRPDAISFHYKNSVVETSSMVIAYLWTGTFTQLDVPANIAISGSPNTVTMIDRDRQVLGMDLTDALGGATSSTPNAECVARLQEKLPASADWTKAVYEFNYTSSAVPEKINVIFSAGDYFSTSRTTADANTLTVDDVKLIYYSTLESLSVNGSDIVLESGKYDYETSADFPENEDALICIVKGNSANATVSLDKENRKASVTVTAPDADIDGKSSHTYTISFATTSEDPTDENTYKYDGTLEIYCELLGGSLTGDTPQDATIHITRTAKNKCDFSLPNFALGDMEIGDINVPDVDLTFKDGVTTVKGYVKDLAIGGDEDTPDEEKIHATVTVSGTIGATGIANLKIDVLWAMDGNVENTEDDNMTPIEVTFNGNGNAIPEGSYLATSVETVISYSNTTTEYFNMNGMRVNNPANGIYIRRQGNKRTKVIFK